MFLKELSLTNYKNFENIKFNFNTKIVCFIGLNGVGKTNILDSIYHLSYTKSYFNPIPSQNIRHNEDFFFNQDFDYNDGIRSPGWARLQNKKLKKIGFRY